MSELTLILASQSPRRRELLAAVLPGFRVQVSAADETLPAGIDPAEAVQLLARKKAEAVLALQPESEKTVVIGADTVVAVDGRILGKPRSREDCIAMLRALSGREHAVHTGVALLRGKEGRVFAETTRVEFWPLAGEDIAWYASTPEPYDKAGGYGIQGLGSILVKGIAGDYFTVMGLPVSRLWRELRAFAPSLVSYPSGIPPRSPEKAKN